MALSPRRARGNGNWGSLAVSAASACAYSANGYKVASTLKSCVCKLQPSLFPWKQVDMPSLAYTEMIPLCCRTQGSIPPSIILFKPSSTQHRHCRIAQGNSARILFPFLFFFFFNLDGLTRLSYNEGLMNFGYLVVSLKKNTST